MTDRAWIEIDLKSLQHNVRVFKAVMPSGCRMMAVVKADAYGHGAQGIAQALEKMGVDAFAVATVDEGIYLRKAGIRSEILILGYTDSCRGEDIYRYALMQTVVSYDHAVRLSQLGYPIRVHIKIDTGMHRLGFDYADADAVAACFAMPELEISGIFSHLCVSDSLDAADEAFTQLQIQRFYGLLEALAERKIAIPKTHLQSSYGLLNHPQLKCDYVRLGIVLFGVHSAPNMPVRSQLELRPVLSLKARIAQLRTIAPGETVGYGRRFAAQRESKVAVIPIGYADGVPRSLSDQNACVLICGKKAPVIGRICMDQLAVDVTDIPEAHTGETVTLIGSDGENRVTAEEWAQKTETLSNEILSRLGKRLPIIQKT